MMSWMMISLKPGDYKNGFLVLQFGIFIFINLIYLQIFSANNNVSCYCVIIAVIM
jgi:hypothetical protein